ncbi:protein phosphatase 2C domain-containing protein [Streptomyces sp. NPDC052069]|uniref:protein phosphatase 2C domain-containing protein n=1 Tax=Streptomyces sp. NPDC052069 TaxID=3154650 RepID=UPI003445BCEB
MSQQGETPAAHEDDWWRDLYDEAAPDTGPSSTADSLDDRFDSVSDTVTSAVVRGGDGAPGAEAHRPRSLPSEPERILEVGPEPGLGVGSTREPDPAPARDPAPDPAPESAPEPEVPPTPLPPPSVSPSPAPSPPPATVSFRAPWEPLSGPPEPRTFAAPPPTPPSPPPEPPQPRRAPDAVADVDADERAPAAVPAPRPVVGYLGDRPPTYDAEPAALPVSTSLTLEGLVPDTVLDGARHGTYTLRAASVRGDSARFRGEPRRDALLTARFGTADNALVLVAMASGARAAEGAHLAAADACRWIAGAVGRSHARLAEDIRAGRRGDLKSGLHRLTDRTYGKLRARAAELGLEPDEYTAGLRCLLLPADPECRTRVFFGVGSGGLFRLRDGLWHDLEPVVGEAVATRTAKDPGTAVDPRTAVATGTAEDPRAGAAAATGTGVGAWTAGDGTPGEESRDGNRLTMDLRITTPPSPAVSAYAEIPPSPRSERFRFRASVARPRDTLLLCSNGLAEPMRGEPALAAELAERWADPAPPGLPAYLVDTQLRIKGYADDRTSAAVWEA